MYSGLFNHRCSGPWGKRGMTFWVFHQLMYKDVDSDIYKSCISACPDWLCWESATPVCTHTSVYQRPLTLWKGNSHPRQLWNDDLQRTEVRILRVVRKWYCLAETDRIGLLQHVNKHHFFPQTAEQPEICSKAVRLAVFKLPSLFFLCSRGSGEVVLISSLLYPNRYIRKSGWFSG